VAQAAAALSSRSWFTGTLGHGGPDARNPI
jgi:hypothetical protein